VIHMPIYKTYKKLDHTDMILTFPAELHENLGYKSMS